MIVWIALAIMALALGLSVAGHIWIARNIERRLDDHDRVLSILLKERNKRVEHGASMESNGGEARLSGSSSRAS